MVRGQTCVSIPEELQKYWIMLSETDKQKMPVQVNFGAKIVKNSCGEIERVDYYSDSGDLIKSIYYNGFSIDSIKYYRNSNLYSEEQYSQGLLLSKGIYDSKGNVKNGLSYEYNRQNQIKSIQKSFGNDIYKVEYGYDELNRVNSRKISHNDKTITEQKYRFDILDRIVEYKDENQQISVLQLSQKNELIYYKITDKIGNKISVTNYFENNRYKKTEVLLNGHKTVVKDECYVDNIMLKKPYTTEDDLDLIISNIFSANDCTTKRSTSTDITDEYMDGIKTRVLPISMRKRVLYNTVLNL